jgi:hypothetical protein
MTQQIGERKRIVASKTECGGYQRLSTALLGCNLPVNVRLYKGRRSREAKMARTPGVAARLLRAFSFVQLLW